MFKRPPNLLYQTYYISEHSQTYFRLYFSSRYSRYMTVDIDFDNLNIQQKGLFRRSFPSEVTVMSKASIIIKPTNSTNWFNSTSCLLKAVGGIYFNYNIGELDSVFMDILSFNFDDTSWIHFDDLSTLYPDEYSTSFEDLINLNGKELWVDIF